jgi:hypothetical protein
MKRRINNDIIANSQARLSHELLDSVYDEKDVNKSFNLFLNTFLRIVYSSFPLIQVKYMFKNNSWTTPGIVKSYKYKGEIYKELRNNNNPMLRTYYRNYSKILTTVIKQNKRNEYDKRILK